MAAAEASRTPHAIDDLDLKRKEIFLHLQREKAIQNMTKLAEFQLNHYENNDFYINGLRHHFLKHQDIVLLQQHPNSRVPQECLFNALSYKLGGGGDLVQARFRGPRLHYSVEYLMKVGHETQQPHLPP